VALLVAVPGLAAGGSHRLSVPGRHSRVACLSPRLCVIGGFDVGQPHGAVLGQVRAGAHVHLSAIPGAQSVLDISCPSSAGCVAIAWSSGVFRFVTTNAAGVPVKVVKFKPAPGVGVQRLACVTVANCVVAGTDLQHSLYEVGTWDGRKVALHGIPLAVGTTGDPVIQDIACAGGRCQVVGYVGQPDTEGGLVITATSLGIPVAVHLIPKFPLFAVSCMSASRCLAVSDNAASGAGGRAIVTLNRGAADGFTRVGGITNLDAIACSATVCELAGQTYASPGRGFVGSLFRLAGGHASGPELVRGTPDVLGVGVLPGGGFATIGVSGANTSLFTTVP
jgi:hypothetical protein